MKKCGLYVHIPFCLSKCFYCDFVSIAVNDDTADKYIDAVLKEASRHREHFSDTQFNTVYIGGGTPSALNIKHFKRLLSGLKKCFQLTPNEFTVEINPATGSKELFDYLKSEGVNRASIGLQCSNDMVLKSINRAHNTADFVNTVKLVQSAGITNISGDVMTMLPNQSIDDVLNTINLINSLGCKHLSMYTLKLEEGTPLYKMYHSKKIILPSEDTEISMSQNARKLLENLGFKRYEISNYAKDSDYSQHNLKYWLRQDYLGLGVSAASCYNDIRYTNTYNLNEYIQCMNNNTESYASYEKLTKASKMDEMLMLNTRLTQGMSYADYKEEFGMDFKSINKEKLASLQKRGMITSCPTHLILTDKGLDLQNQVLLELL